MGGQGQPVIRALSGECWCKDDYQKVGKTLVAVKEQLDKSEFYHTELAAEWSARQARGDDGGNAVRDDVQLPVEDQLVVEFCSR